MYGLKLDSFSIDIVAINVLSSIVNNTEGDLMQPDCMKYRFPLDEANGCVRMARTSRRDKQKIMQLPQSSGVAAAIESNSKNRAIDPLNIRFSDKSGLPFHREIMT